MSELIKYEKETIVRFNETEDTASIYTYNTKLRKRLEAFRKKILEPACRQAETGTRNCCAESIQGFGYESV